MKDAPDDLAGLMFGGLLGYATGKITYESRKDTSQNPYGEAVAAGVFVGLIGYAFVKWLANL